MYIFREGQPFEISIDGEKYAVCISKDYTKANGLYTLNVANDKRAICLSCKISAVLSDIRKLCYMLTNSKSKRRLICNFAVGFEQLIIRKRELLAWIKEEFN